MKEQAIIATYTGRHLDLLRPHTAEIHIDDIAAALTRIRRFNGHTLRPYSVAEHLLLGVEQCTPASRLHWMTHDFSEAYLGDVTGPLKKTDAMGAYRVLEFSWQGAIEARFGVPTSTRSTQEVEIVDKRMLLTEQRDLMGRRPQSTDRLRPFAMEIPRAEPSEDFLRQRFLKVFRAVVKGTKGAQM